MKQLMTLLMCFNLIIAPVAFAADPKPDGNASQQFRANPEAKDKKAGYGKQILAMGIGIAAANALTACASKIHPSVAIYAAGGIIYILSEMLGGKAHNDALKKKAEDLKLAEEKMKKIGGGGEVQREALQSALENERETLKFINKRKTWLGAISVVFMAATAAALIELISPPLLPIGMIPAGCVGPASGPMAIATTSALVAAFSFASGGGLTGAFAGALIATAVPLAIASTSVMNFAVGRIAVAASSMIIINGIKKDLTDRGRITKENIEKLEKAIAAYDKESAPTNGIASDTSKVTSGSEDGSSGNFGAGNIKSGSGVSSAVTKLPGGTPASSKICAANSSQGLEVSEKACANTLVLKPVNFDPSINSPSLKAVSQTANDVANSLSSGDLGGAELSAANLASQAGRIEKVRDDLLKQVNQQLIAKNKKPIDLQASGNEQLLAMSDAVKPADADSSKLLASLAGSSVDLPTDLKGAGDLKENIQEITSTEQLNKTAPNAAAGANSTYTEPAFNQAAADAEAAANAEANADALNMQKGLEGFEDSQSDISTKADVSLFKQVSNRYILNYPTLVRRKSLEATESTSK